MLDYIPSAGICVETTIENHRKTSITFILGWWVNHMTEITLRFDISSYFSLNYNTVKNQIGIK